MKGTYLNKNAGLHLKNQYKYDGEKVPEITSKAWPPNPFHLIVESLTNPQCRPANLNSIYLHIPVDHFSYV